MYNETSNWITITKGHFVVPTQIKTHCDTVPSIWNTKFYLIFCRRISWPIIDSCFIFISVYILNVYIWQPKEFNKMHSVYMLICLCFLIFHAYYITSPDLSMPSKHFIDSCELFCVILATHRTADDGYTIKIQYIEQPSKDI